MPPKSIKPTEEAPLPEGSTTSAIWVSLFEPGNPNPILEDSVSILDTANVAAFRKVVKLQFAPTLDRWAPAQFVVKCGPKSASVHPATKISAVGFPVKRGQRQACVEVPKVDIAGHVPTYVPTLVVRRLAGDCSTHYVVAGSWEEFKVRLSERGFGTPKLYYYFKKDGVYDKSVRDRIPIADSASFTEFLGCKVPRPEILAFPESSVKATSSGNEKLDEEEERWSNAVKAMDGFKCVVCKEKQKHAKKELEAAHHIGVDVKLDKSLFELQYHHECANGLCMCATCHKLYDAFLFYIDATGTIQVSSEALLQLAPEWRVRHGTKIELRPTRKGRNVITDEMAAYRKQKCEIGLANVRSHLHVLSKMRQRELASMFEHEEEKCKKRERLVTPHTEKTENNKRSKET